MDHQHGAWFRLLNRQNVSYNNQKSLPGAKSDFHTLGMVFELLRIFD